MTKTGQTECFCIENVTQHAFIHWGSTDSRQTSYCVHACDGTDAPRYQFILVAADDVKTTLWCVEIHQYILECCNAPLSTLIKLHCLTLIFYFNRPQFLLECCPWSVRAWRRIGRTLAEVAGAWVPPLRWGEATFEWRLQPDVSALTVAGISVDIRC